MEHNATPRWAAIEGVLRCRDSSLRDVHFLEPAPVERMFPYALEIVWKTDALEIVAIIERACFDRL